jgi:WD40 repeat protein
MTWLAALTSVVLVVSYAVSSKYFSMTVHYARLNSLSLADRARTAARAGDARLGALLARAALPVIPNIRDPGYVAEVEVALVDALSRPIETMRKTVLNDEDDSVVFSPDGARMVSMSSNTLYLWNAVTGEPIGKPLKGHTNDVNSAAFSPDGKIIVSASDDTTLRLWDAATGEPLGNPLQGHTGAVKSVAYSPDGTRIVSASKDKTLRLWDAASGTPVGDPLQGDSGGLMSAVFSPAASAFSPSPQTILCSCGTLLPKRRLAGPSESLHPATRVPPLQI